MDETAGVSRQVNWKAFAWLGAVLLLASWVGFISLFMLFHRNMEDLRSRNEGLAKENASLKQTADYYYRLGMSLWNSGDLSGARDAFTAVAVDFPTSPLVGPATNRMADMNRAIERAKLEQEKRDAERGEDIDYTDFYVKAKDTGLIIGKRYRFRAEIDETMLISEPGTATHGFSKTLHSVREFDDAADYEKLLRNSGNERQVYDIVASMGPEGVLHVHEVE